MWDTFSDQEYIAWYDSVAIRRIVEPKCIDYDLLRSGLLDNLNELFEVGGWMDFIKLDKLFMITFVGSF